MSELLSNNSCFLQIEIWEQNLDELSNYLEKKGYKFVKKLSVSTISKTFKK